MMLLVNKYDVCLYILDECMFDLKFCPDTRTILNYVVDGKIMIR